jgi:cell division cycle 20-like protein 1 (cofactor of APC complex)
VRIFDVEKKKMISRYNNHLGRVGTIDFNHNIMATGSKDERIMLTDIRTSMPHCKFYGHRQEVCGVKFSFDDAYLASGGNDNAVYIWSPKMAKQIVRFDKHVAAVKGLAWSPHKHSLLVSGGGTTDKSIKLWNAQ